MGIQSAVRIKGKRMEKEGWVSSLKKVLLDLSKEKLEEVVDGFKSMGLMDLEKIARRSGIDWV